MATTDPIAVFDIVPLDELPAYLGDTLTVTALRWQGRRLVAEVKEVRCEQAYQDKADPVLP